MLVLRVFKNNELNEAMLVKKNKLLKPEKVSKMKKFVGEHINFPDAFDAIYENSDEKISFSDLADWVLQKSLEMEVGKNKKKEEVKEKDELDETND